MEVKTGSETLSQLDIKLNMGSLSITVLWFRVMQESNNWSISRHMHSSYEFHFVHAGASHVKLDNSEFDVSEGEFYLTAPGIFHEQSHSDFAPYTEYSINCDLMLDEDVADEESVLYHVLKTSGCRPVKDIFGAMNYFNKALEEAENEALGYYNIIKNLAAMILISAARALSDTAVLKYSVPKRTANDAYRFAHIRQFVEDNVYVNITSKDIKNHIYLSEKQICRIIKQHTGKSTRQYINSVRLQKAKSLLAGTNSSLREISEQLGFTSEYYFNQFFKREEGYPPGIFRNNVQKT